VYAGVFKQVRDLSNQRTVICKSDPCFFLLCLCAIVFFICSSFTILFSSLGIICVWKPLFWAIFILVFISSCFLSSSRGNVLAQFISYL
jgi:hypothetical protein